MRSTPRYKSKYECYRVVKGLEFNEKEIEELKYGPTHYLGKHI